MDGFLIISLQSIVIIRFTGGLCTKVPLLRIRQGAVIRSRESHSDLPSLPSIYGHVSAKRSARFALNLMATELTRILVSPDRPTALEGQKEMPLPGQDLWTNYVRIKS